MDLLKTRKFSSIIHENYLLTSIIYRFGIKLGFGDKTIEQVCAEYKIDSDFFLEIIKVFTDKNYISESLLMNKNIPFTIDYLSKSHSYYNKVKIPFIESLINEMTWKDEGNKNNKEILKKFFNNYRKEVGEHTKNEELVVYPHCLDVYKYHLKGKNDLQLKEKIKKYSIKNYAEKHEELNASLLDLKNIIIKYLPPPENNLITEQILYEIFRLEKDMEDHTRIEDTILVPVISKMEQEILKN